MHLDTRNKFNSLNIKFEMRIFTFQNSLNFEHEFRPSTIITFRTHNSRLVLLELKYNITIYFFKINIKIGLYFNIS